MPPLLPLFLDLAGRRVLLVGGGPVAAAKLVQLLAARAEVRIVSPEVCAEIDQSGVPIARRRFEPADLDEVWLAVAAATPDVNEQVVTAAEARRVFVNAVDDPAHATAYLSGVVRRDGVTLAISTSGAAPALTALLREALDAVLPADLATWVEESRVQRARWRRDRVPIAARRRLLLDALNAIYKATDKRVDHAEITADHADHAEHAEQDNSLSKSTTVDVSRSEMAAERPGQGDKSFSAISAISAVNVRSGHVSLVGAGPGDPGLLTRRALARLRTADLVLYDALIDRRVLKLARHAQRFFVGKRAHRQAMSQQAINGVMIRAARRGKRVVRLKGGDPFVFGRGGEEALALRAAGVAFDVVPGVTSAVAAPALAGIPVTLRGVSSAFLVVGGHDADAFGLAIDAVVPDQVTLVVLMGAGHRVAIANRLLERGWGKRTPAAIVVDASKPTQSVWRGTLEQLAAGSIAVDGDGPATIVVGQVIAAAGVSLEVAADARESRARQ
jgi:uroporphyrin-III C-methyltransferase / precorrin-2 dehydrogenase / sirohydrochlorin ferrochelatase